jgi:hypothetical protein
MNRIQKSLLYLISLSNRIRFGGTAYFWSLIYPLFIHQGRVSCISYFKFLSKRIPLCWTWSRDYMHCHMFKSTFVVYLTYLRGYDIHLHQIQTGWCIAIRNRNIAEWSHKISLVLLHIYLYYSPFWNLCEPKLVGNYRDQNLYRVSFILAIKYFWENPCKLGVMSIIKLTKVEIRPFARTSSATYWNISNFLWQLWRYNIRENESVLPIELQAWQFLVHWPIISVTHNIQIRCILVNLEWSFQKELHKVTQKRTVHLYWRTEQRDIVIMIHTFLLKIRVITRVHCVRETNILCNCGTASIIILFCAILSNI